MWGWWMLHLIDNLFPPHLPPRSLSLSSSSWSTSIWHLPLFSYSTAPSYISSPRLSLFYIFLLSLTFSTSSLNLPTSSSRSTPLLFPSYITSTRPVYLICTGLFFLLPCTPLSTYTACPVDLGIGSFSTTLTFYTPVSLPL
ncbi:hypothetical protein ASPBRDRAFT_67470 [Aspergillus brasiliensis CBS 101740]|uniref:Uncharacterized protein n=1 Tax=Aspergillus brasiliensis (strain CBS 101740 / IMI 381727 / IBT 21946) TaxID=767769 RepID=A0A1L9UD42_ASPBC|nr:hypothetical protein ASPBRDRAFT_67470 [Aspergillus brasiliensis CBS 101740]